MEQYEMIVLVLIVLYLKIVHVFAPVPIVHVIKSGIQTAPAKIADVIKFYPRNLVKSASVSIVPVTAKKANVNAMTVNVRNAQARYANAGDLDSLQDIELLVDWYALLHNKELGLIVLEHKTQVIGVYSFKLSKTTYFVSNFFVKEQFRRKKMASRLMDDLKERTYKTNHKLISINVPEWAVDLQLFLKHHEFTAIKSYENTYQMIFRV